LGNTALSIQQKNHIGKHCFIHTAKSDLGNTQLCPYSKKIILENTALSIQEKLILENTALSIQQKSHMGKHCFMHTTQKSNWKTLFYPYSKK
jgi:hypothetical protein